MYGLGDYSIEEKLISLLGEGAGVALQFAYSGGQFQDAELFQLFSDSFTRVRGLAEDPKVHGILIAVRVTDDREFVELYRTIKRWLDSSVTCYASNGFTVYQIDMPA